MSDDGVRERKKAADSAPVTPGTPGSSGQRRTAANRGAASTSIFFIIPAILAGLLFTSAAASFAMAAGSPPAPGTVHNVGHFGQSLHVHCMGGDEDGGDKASSKDLVILLHDMLTEGGSGSFFLPLMLELRAAGHRSCAVDAAGHGFSTAFHGSATEYAGRRSRVAAAEAVEALVDAGELREIAQGEDPDSREYESARGDRVVIVGFGTGSYAARFMSQLVMTKGRPGASGDLRPAPTVHLEPSTPSSPLMRAPHLASRSSLVEMFHIFSYIGVTRWAVIAGAHPMLGAVSKAGPPLRDIFEHELAAPRAHGSEIAGLAVLKDIHTEARAQLPGYNRKKKDAASDSATVPEGPVAAVLIGDSESPGPAGDSDVRGAQVDEMRTFAKAVKARATTTIRGARRLVHVDEPVQVARAIGKALQV